MNRPRIVAALCALVVVASVAACGEQPTAKPPSGTQVAELPHSGAPKVTEPLDTARFEADPCALISKATLDAAGVPIDDTKSEPGKAEGPTCTWYGPLEWGQFGAALLTTNREGLSVQYEKNNAGEFKYFEPVDVATYPAVFYSGFDNRQNGDCTIGVGVRDDLALWLFLQADREGPFYKDPCAGAKKLASLAVQTMKSGG